MLPETPPQLTIVMEDNPSLRWVFSGDVPLQIGRSPENDIYLDHPELSRNHCTVFFADGAWQCSDLSRNGIFVGGERVPHVHLTEGVVVQLSFGGPRLRFTLEAAASEPPGPIDDPVTHWLDEVRGGRNTAARKLWDRYFARVVQIARNRLGNTPRRVSDEEDVASGAMASLLLGLREDRFEGLADRYELWKLLVVLTNRNAADQVNAQRRLKRGGGRVRGDSIFNNVPDDVAGGFDLLAGDEPTPEFLAAMAEETERRLTALNDETLQAIALWKLEGWSNQEIADAVGCSERTVERRLNEIRVRWSSASEENLQTESADQTDER